MSLFIYLSDHDTKRGRSKNPNENRRGFFYNSNGIVVQNKTLLHFHPLSDVVIVHFDVVCITSFCS